MKIDSPGFNINFENAPFKLTREYLEVMGGINSPAFKMFEDLFVRGFYALQKHVEGLGAIVQVRHYFFFVIIYFSLFLFMVVHQDYYYSYDYLNMMIIIIDIISVIIIINSINMIIIVIIIIIIITTL